jgi:UDPglucose 6-dehydrogenase
MKLGIIGCGFVGGTTYEVLKEHYETAAYDKFKIEFKNNFNKLSECPIIFIAVPTPMSNSGKIDLTILDEVLNSLEKLNFQQKPILVIRSTAIPGTTEQLSNKYNFEFVYNPEFLREKHALEDFRNMNRVILGSDKKENLEKIKSIYLSFLPNATYVFTDWKTAEMMKYASNVTLASQIIIANELYNVCKNLDIDYEEIRKILGLDDRISTKHMKVPGHDGDFGFGGKCFPKDLNALIQISKEKGYNPEFFESVWEANKRFRNWKDWKEIPGATSENNNFQDVI